MSSEDAVSNADNSTILALIIIVCYESDTKYSQLLSFAVHPL